MPFIVTAKRPVAPDEHGQPFCAACSHYHEGACLCPDCGRPTPCREHHAATSVATPAIETVARRAVATPEEARHEAERALINWQRTTGQKPDPRAHVYAARTLPESGGRVGPLPDGTV